MLHQVDWQISINHPAQHHIPENIVSSAVVRTSDPS